MNTFHLRCFGVGDGKACEDRNHSSFLYTFDDASVLVDCGESASRSFKASGLSCEAVDRVFLSHLHSDHFGGLFMFVQGLWLENRKRPLPVYLPADGIRPLRAMFAAAYLFEEVLSFRVAFEPLQAGRIITVGGVRVTAFRTSHLDGMRKRYLKRHAGDYAAYCFLFETDCCRIGHSADLGSPMDLDPLLNKPLDLLVCELDHFPAERLFVYLKGRKIKHLVLTHLGRRYWRKLEEIRQRAVQALPGIRVSIPRDQDVISL